MNLSALVIPAILLLFGFVIARRPPLFDAFVEGATDGLKTTVRLLPSMVLLMVGLTMFTESGAANAIASLLSPFCERLGIPAEILPLVITRPLSGSAANAAYAKLLEDVSPDSFPAFAASILMGSSDTLFYVISVYFAPTRVKKTRHAFPAAGATALLCLFLSCIVASFFFQKS